MYTCPNCGRDFKNKNQPHFCGEKPTSIAEYIECQAEATQADLRLVYETLRKALPNAQEKISWSMPTFWKKRNIIHFAASKKHIGIYPGPAAVAHFQEKLKDYKTSKGTIQMPYGNIDKDLLTDLAHWCWEQLET